MNSSQKQTYCSGGCPHSQTVIQNLYEKVNTKRQFFLFINGTSSFSGQSKSQYFTK